MKPPPLLLAALVAVSISTQAQDLHFGIKAGANINKISGQSLKDQFTYGYNAGVYLQIPFNKKWSIQPEVLFTQHSTDTSDRFSELYKFSGDKISNMNLNYLAIPVLLNYKVSKLFSLQAGPQFGILMSNDKNLVEEGKAAFKNGEFSLLGGIQFHLAGFRAFGRYQLGLNNINDIDNKDKWRSQSVQLGVGFNLF
ncbi:MAG TPA: porin family protein [Ferruginibacter sp.]|nr:porin family protein [Ferruginibacter sp.]HMP21287.1 porin family protein [Ferruginibacter sp.]